jgi:hypothetical protein
VISSSSGLKTVSMLPYKFIGALRDVALHGKFRRST